MMAAVKVGQRSYLSSWMLRAAKRFTAQAQAIETEHPGDWTKGEQHVDLVMAAVLNAAAFMEAMINEVFTDAADGHGDLTPLSSVNTRVMADWWREFDDGRGRTLTKYQLLLTFAGKPKLDTGAEPYQSAQALIDLRNAIVHYRPETIWSDEVHRLTRRLQGRFVSNALLHPSTDLRWPNGLPSAPVVPDGATNRRSASLTACSIPSGSRRITARSACSQKIAPTRRGGSWSPSRTDRRSHVERSDPAVSDTGPARYPRDYRTGCSARSVRPRPLPVGSEIARRHGVRPDRTVRSGDAEPSIGATWATGRRFMCSRSRARGTALGGHRGRPPAERFRTRNIGACTGSPDGGRNGTWRTPAQPA